MGWGGGGGGKVSQRGESGLVLRGGISNWYYEAGKQNCSAFGIVFEGRN